jgi:hypothetical protein
MQKLAALPVGTVSSLFVIFTDVRLVVYPDGGADKL